MTVRSFSRHGGLGPRYTRAVSRTGAKLLGVAAGVARGRDPDRLLHLGLPRREHDAVPAAGAGGRQRDGEPDAPDGRGRRPDPRPEPRLGLVPRPRRQRPLAAHDRLHAPGERDRPRDDLQLRRRERPAQPVLRPAAGLVGQELVDGKPLASMPPDQPSHTFAVPALGMLVPIAPVADDAKNQCGYAPCALSMAHRTITFTFRTGKPRPLPLAVLRPVRSRLHVRLRRADADDRLHGRLPERGLAMATPAIAPIVVRSRTAAVPHRVDRAERDRDAARRDLPRPGDPARQRQRPGDRAGLRQHGAGLGRRRRSASSSCSSSATRSRPSAAAAAELVDGPPIRGDSRIQLLWIVITTVDRALPRRLRHVRAASRTAPAAARARRGVPARRATSTRWTSR